MLTRAPARSGRHDDGDGEVADRRRHRVDVAHQLDAIDEDRQDPDHRHDEDAQQHQVAPARHFQRRGLARLLVGVGGGAVGDGEPVEDAIGGHHHARGGDRPAPAVVAAIDVSAMVGSVIAAAAEPKLPQPA
jgi:hypothetical protein